MNLDTVPAEVLSHCVLPLLGNKDLLRLRTISHGVQENIRVHLERHTKNEKIYYIGSDTQVPIVNKEDASWHHFDYMSMRKLLTITFPIPPQRFFFNFQNQDIFSDESWMIQRFTETHGHRVRELYLSQLTLPLEGHTSTAFFSALQSALEKLSLEVLDFTDVNTNEERVVASGFQNVTTLDIDRLILNRDNGPDELRYFWRIVASCTRLESLTFPFYMRHAHFLGDIEFVNLGYHHVSHLLEQGSLTSLKFYNLNNLQGGEVEDPGEGTFVQFCETLGRRGIKLIDLDYRCFMQVTNQQQLRTIGAAIYSMKNYSLMRGGMELPNMQKLYLNTLSCVGGGLGPDEEFEPPSWPMLNTLKLEIFSDVLNDGTVAIFLYEVLFNRVRRPSMRTLDISVVDFEEEAHFDLPAFNAIAWSCHNLSTLVIQNWHAPDASFANLWSGLPNLESVTLHNCPAIGYWGFIGRNEEQPVLLQLQHLKKFHLIMVQNMENITDAIFEAVFRHLRVKEFVLDSYADEIMNALIPINSFTEAAVESLKTSHFAETIETFPFSCWMLQGFTEEQMLQLGQPFRSSKMIGIMAP